MKESPRMRLRMMQAAGRIIRPRKVETLITAIQAKQAIQAAP